MLRIPLFFLLLTLLALAGPGWLFVLLAGLTVLSWAICLLWLFWQMITAAPPRG